MFSPHTQFTVLLNVVLEAFSFNLEINEATAAKRSEMQNVFWVLNTSSIYYGQAEDGGLLPPLASLGRRFHPSFSFPFAPPLCLISVASSYCFVLSF